MIRFMMPSPLARADSGTPPPSPFYAGGPETNTRLILGSKGKRTILYVEDDFTDAHLLKAALDEGDNSVRLVIFRDPSEALLVCSHAVQAPDLVVLDINMPRIGGIELLERLKELPAFAGTPIVMLTTSRNELHRRQSLEAGAAGYLVKPLLFEGYDLIAKDLRQRLGLGLKS